MHSSFNKGIGMVVVDATHAQAKAQSLRAAGEQVFEIGRIAAQGEGAQVEVR